MNELSTNQTEILVQDTPKYAVFQLPNGKYEKRMKYEKQWSFIPETNEELVQLYQIMNEDSELVKPMKSAVGEIFDIKNVYFNPYESFDEETGTSTAGVTTMLETTEGAYFATSSKTVYYNLQNMFDVFGFPGTEKYLGVRVAIVSEKQKKGDQISLKMLGLTPQ